MQASDWLGRTGESWASEWRRTDRSFAGLDAALERAILAVSPAGAARLVDLGCGAGKTSLAIAEALPRAEVVGLDLSPDLIAVADQRRNERNLSTARCRFIAGDAINAAATLAPVDLFFSRHGVMFFDDPTAAFTRLATTARPGAPLIFSCFAGAGRQSLGRAQRHCGRRPASRAGERSAAAARPVRLRRPRARSCAPSRLRLAPGHGPTAGRVRLCRGGGRRSGRRRGRFLQPHRPGIAGAAGGTGGGAGIAVRRPDRALCRSPPCR